MTRTRLERPEPRAVPVLEYRRVIGPGRACGRRRAWRGAPRAAGARETDSDSEADAVLDRDRACRRVPGLDASV